MIGKLATIN